MQAAMGTVEHRRARGIVLAVQVASAVAFAAPFRRTNGFPLDDAWIHHVVARTFATTGTLGFRPGAHGAGATSYLWAALLAAGHLLHVDPVVASDVLGVAAALAAGQALLLLACDEDGRVARSRLFAVAIACAGGDLTWFAFSGMEATLLVATSLGAIAAVTRARGPRSPGGPRGRGFVLAGALAAAAALTRPDAVPLGACLMAYTYFVRRKWADALAIGAPWAAACALYFGSNLALAGHALPATLRGRRWLWIDSIDPSASFATLSGSFAEAWADRIRHYTLGTDAVFLLWTTLGLAAFGVTTVARERSRTRTRTRGAALAAAWCAIHVGVFLVVLPVPGHGGRYQPLVPVLWVLFAAIGTFELAAAVARRLVGANANANAKAMPVAVVVAGGLVAAAWAADASYAWLGWRAAHADAVEHVHVTEEAAGRAAAGLPAEARVATFDVGAIGWLARRPLLDLGALTDASVVDDLVSDAIVDRLERDGITHLVLPAGEDADLDDLSSFAFRLGIAENPRIEREAIASFAAASRERWLRGVSYTNNATYQQVVYRVRYGACPRWSHEPVDGWLVEGVALSAPARRRLERAYADASARGLCVRAEAGHAPAPVPGCWSVRLGESADARSANANANAIEAWPSEVGAAVVAVARAEVARAALPYGRAGDEAGEARVVLHALAKVEREHLAACFYTRLPALDRPSASGRDAKASLSPADSAPWGVPLAAAIFAAGILASRRARDASDKDRA